SAVFDFRSSLNPHHGGETGKISSYSQQSSFCPSRAGTRTRSSFISSRAKILRNLVMNRSARRRPASCWSWRMSSAGPSRTKKPKDRSWWAFARRAWRPLLMAVELSAAFDPARFAARRRLQHRHPRVLETVIALEIDLVRRLNIEQRLGLVLHGELRDLQGIDELV